MSVVAKFVVQSVDPHRHKPDDAQPYCTSITMRPVYGGEENRAFWEATPAGSLNLFITNAAAAQFFRPGDVHLLTFEPTGERE